MRLGKENNGFVSITNKVNQLSQEISVLEEKRNMLRTINGSDDKLNTLSLTEYYLDKEYQSSIYSLTNEKAKLLENSFDIDVGLMYAPI